MHGIITLSLEYSPYGKMKKKHTHKTKDRVNYHMMRSTNTGQGRMEWNEDTVRTNPKFNQKTETDTIDTFKTHKRFL